MNFIFFIHSIHTNIIGDGFCSAQEISSRLQGSIKWIFTYLAHLYIACIQYEPWWSYFGIPRKSWNVIVHYVLKDKYGYDQFNNIDSEKGLNVNNIMNSYRNKEPNNFIYNLFNKCLQYWINLKIRCMTTLARSYVWWIKSCAKM